MIKEINIIGGGLAGSEAAFYLLNKGYKVNLYEMKPVKFSPAHKNSNLAELVCSNSFKSTEVTTAAGLLKEELKLLGSKLIEIANIVKVPSGKSLSVDRDLFSELVTKELKKFKNLNIKNQEVVEFDVNLPTIIATGPLTSDNLSKFILEIFGQKQMYFFDAIAPIVEADSIDYEKAYFANRYDKGQTKDFINCPMEKDEYLKFHNALISAEIVKLKDFENDKVFEGCMPVEVLAKRGVDTLRFGPLKPVGLTNPNTNKTPYAVVQLRKENLQNLSYNLVGFQTNLTYKSQKEIFSLIPGLENATFLRYGVMHKNAYIVAPNILNKYYQSIKYPNLFIAGQLSGVEGYIESISSGLSAAINLDRFLNNLSLVDFTTHTIIGGLSNYISTANASNFQPMGSNMGLLTPLNDRIKDKKQKNLMLSEISLKTISDIKEILS